MKNKVGRLFMVLGSLLILSSIGLLIYNKEESEHAGESSADALTKIHETVKENESLPPKAQPVSPEAPVLPQQPPPLVSVDIDGYGYIGYISIPSLGLELPVMDDWDYQRLRIAPCRQWGETVEKMIIAGHNYVTHFGPLHSLTGQEAVYFTDMEGKRTDYVVDTVDIVGPNGFDALKESSWNLVLYTCTLDGRRRVMVGCKMI